MSQLWCSECQKPIDARHGHNCVQRWRIPERLNRNIPKFQTIREKPHGISQFAPPVIEEQTNRPISVCTELGNTNPNLFLPTSLTDLTTYFNDLRTHSSQVRALEGMTGQLITGNTEQSLRGSYVIKEQFSQALPFKNELGRTDYNLAMESGVQNSQRVLDNSRMTTTELQLETSQNTLTLNIGNNYQELTLASGSIDRLTHNENQTDTQSIKHQKQGNVQKDQQLLNISQAHRCPGYKIRGGINEMHFIDKKGGRFTVEFAMQRSVCSDKKAMKGIRLNEMNRQFSKYGQNARRMWWKGHLGNRTQDLRVKSTEDNKELNKINLHAVNFSHHSGTYHGSLNTHARWKERNEEKLWQGCTTPSSENNLDFNKIHLGSQEESNPVTSESIQACSVNDAPAVAGPSCSRDSERTCPLCWKEFTTKSIMKRHFKEHSDERPFSCNICGQGFKRKSILNQHMVVHARDTT